MKTKPPDSLVSFERDSGLDAMWQKVFYPAPLVVVGTREANGEHDLAPKHMASPLGPEGYFGFMCTESHSTLRNARREGCFAVSFPRPDRAILAALSAAPRTHHGTKPMVATLPTFPATQINALFLSGGHLFLECKLERITSGFGSYSLVAGKILVAHVAATALREEDRDDQDLISDHPLLAYISPGSWSTIDRTFSLPLPKGFSH